VVELSLLLFVQVDRPPYNTHHYWAAMVYRRAKVLIVGEGQEVDEEKKKKG
jgi:hypothetical protein